MGDINIKIKEKLGKIKNDMKEDNIVLDERGNTKHIVCWKCGVEVAGWIDSDVKETRKEGDKILVFIKQKFDRYENYAKVECQLSDGALYSPVFCTTCVPKVTQGDIEKVFCRDLEKWSKQNNKKLVDHLVTKTAALKKEGE
jgi:D-mannonate dehydratase